MNEADRRVYVSQVRRILSSEMLSERIVELFEMEMDECRADAKRNIQHVKDLIAVVYDGQDQAYQDLLDENDSLRKEIENIASLIHYQAPLNAQDKWLADVIEYGFYTPEQEEE